MDYVSVDKVGIKENDVLEISLRVEMLVPEQDKSKPVYNTEDYEHEYSITYMLNGKHCLGGADFKFEAGILYEYDNDIIGLVKEEIKNSFPEIIDYEIIKAEDSDYTYQYAEVKIKSIKS